MDVKLILIPVDFSNHCKLALNYAVSIAHKFGAKLELLHVVETKSFYSEYTEMEPMADYRNRRLQEIQADLEELKLRLPDSSDLDIEMIMHEGHPAEDIANTATRDEVDLIVISAPRKKFRPHVFFSGVADQIVRGAKCPVLSVLRPKDQDFSDGIPQIPALRRILVASDLSNSSFRALDAALCFADKEHAKLELLHVGDQSSLDTSAARKSVVESMKKAVRSHHKDDIEVEYLVDHGKPEKAILAESVDESCDLIVMYTHGRHGLQHALHHNVCEKVLSSAHCPVLTVREE